MSFIFSVLFLWHISLPIQLSQTFLGLFINENYGTLKGLHSNVFSKKSLLSLFMLYTYNFNAIVTSVLHYDCALTFEDIKLAVVKRKNVI